MLLGRFVFVFLYYRLHKKNKYSDDTSSSNSLDTHFGWAGAVMSLGILSIWMNPPEGLNSSDSYLKLEDN